MEENGDFQDIIIEDSMVEEKAKEQAEQYTTRPRKPARIWSLDEHRWFMRGLEIWGKGDWRNIAKYFVPSRTPSQVASHAQKFLKRVEKEDTKKCRTTINDIQLMDAFKDNKLYEDIMEEFEDYGSVAFFGRVAQVMPWKTMTSIKLHHQVLMEELDWIKSSNANLKTIYHHLCYYGHGAIPSQSVQ
ncbi:hypothetical protein AgCh_030436 [Apium graveolens]